MSYEVKFNEIIDKLRDAGAKIAYKDTTWWIAFNCYMAGWNDATSEERESHNREPEQSEAA